MWAPGAPARVHAQPHIGLLGPRVALVPHASPWGPYNRALGPHVSSECGLLGPQVDSLGPRCRLLGPNTGSGAKNEFMGPQIKLLRTINRARSDVKALPHCSHPFHQTSGCAAACNMVESNIFQQTG